MEIFSSTPNKTKLSVDEMTLIIASGLVNVAN